MKRADDEATRRREKVEAEAWRDSQLRVQRGALTTLLDLGESNLEKLSRRQQAALVAAVNGFVLTIPQMAGPNDEGHVIPLGSPESLSLDDLREIQGELRSGLNQLFPRVPLRPPYQWQPPVSVASVEIARGLQHFGLIYVVDWPASFWLAAMRLIEQHGKQVRRCVSCGRLFVRTKRKEYCSAACSQRARSRQWYEKHKDEILERRHLAYKAKHKGRKVPRQKRTAPSVDC